MNPNNPNNANNNQTSNPNVRVINVDDINQYQAVHQQVEENAKNNISTVIYDNTPMTQERAAALMNRMVRRAGIVSGNEGAEEVRKIMGNAIDSQFGESVSDNEGNSSEEERSFSNRISNLNGRGGRNPSGRGGRGGGRF
jgi:hypothetical protein